MIFGVFVARADTPASLIREAHAVLLSNLERFETEEESAKASHSMVHGKIRLESMTVLTSTTVKCSTD